MRPFRLISFLSPSFRWAFRAKAWFELSADPLSYARRFYQLQATTNFALDQARGRALDKGNLESVENAISLGQLRYWSDVTRNFNPGHAIKNGHADSLREAAGKPNAVEAQRMVHDRGTPRLGHSQIRRHEGGRINPAFLQGPRLSEVTKSYLGKGK